VFPRYLDVAYPNVEKGSGVRLTLDDGREILDACSGGAMVASLGHGVREIVEAGPAQAEQLSYVYNHHFTNERQELLAERLVEVAAPEMARVRFVSGGSEANETVLRLARQYHVDRGDTERWRVISPSQAYHGATMGALALVGRPALQRPFEGYLANHLHFDGTLEELDRVIEEAGPETIAAFVCEPISAAARPAYSPPDEFWHGLAERRERHGFLVCFDEIVTGMGRTGSWFAYQQLPIEPDVVSAGKGMGAGYFPLAGVLCRSHVFDALAGEFEHGHTWDGAPLPCAVGLAVLDYLVSNDLVERVRERGPSLRDELEAAVGGLPIVREVRGRGFLLGVELSVEDPARVDDTALAHGVLVTTSQNQTLLAPAYTSTDAELAEMIERFAAALREVG
jgi:hypothetical protein